MKRKYALWWFVGIVITLVLAWFVLGSRRTPQGQQPLTSLDQSKFEQFKRDFDAAAGDTRLLLLLSPT
jgi:hypothetical protein